jgi:hypothetical protein
MYSMTDTDEDIHPSTPEEDDAYKGEMGELKEDAAALMATVRHLLTGIEIDTLEAAIAQDGGTVDMAIFESMRIQFYAQMVNHRDGRANA